MLHACLLRARALNYKAMKLQAITKQRGFIPPFLPKGIFNKERAGFTLVEIVVSVVIIALTAAGIFTSFIAAQNYVSRSKGKVSTSNAERQQIEALKAEARQEAWDSIANTYNTADCDPDQNGLALTASLNCTNSSAGWTGWKNVTGTFGQAPYNGKRRYRVTELTPGGSRQAEVQLNWTEPGT